MEWPLVGRAQLLDQISRALRKPPRSVVLEGALGVGKTRLLRAVAERHRAEGWYVEVCTGAPSAAAIPFGAMAHLLPPMPAGDVPSMLEQARRRLLASAGGAPLLLAVDDVQHLDPGSLTLVHLLATSRDAAVLLARRDGEPGEGTVTALWKDGHATRIEVQPLDRASFDLLLATMHERAIAGELADRLWSLTRGNALFLRELLLQMVERPDPLDREALGLNATLGTSPRLAAIIESRLARLSPLAHRALDVVALAEPIRLNVLLRIVEETALAELESHALIAFLRDGAVEEVRTAHPIYGEIVRTVLPTMTRRLLIRQLAGTLLDDALRAPGDALRAVAWLAEANEPVSSGLASMAAVEALAKGDAPLAERLAREVPESARDPHLLSVLGSALSAQHRFEEARFALEQAVSAASDDHERVAAALASARHLVWMEHEFERGVELLQRTAAAVTDAAAVAEVRAELAIFAAVAGDARETVRISAEVLDEPSAGPRVLLSALVQSTLARTMLGQFDGLEAALDRADVLAAELRDQLPLAAGQLVITRAMWQRFVQLDRAAALAEEAWRQAMSQGGGAAFCSAALAWIQGDRGDLDGMFRVANRAAAEARAFDPFHNLPMVLSLIAFAYALRGHSIEARRALAELGDIDQLEARTRTFADRALVWARSQADEAPALAVAAGHRAEAGTMVAWAAPLFHDAVRLGDAALALGPLSHLASRIESPVIQAMAQHARAAVDHDPAALVAAAADFLACGSRILAAEALAQAVDHTTAATVERARLAATALFVASTCPGAATPLLAGIASPLSSRETEIGVAAAAGATSRQIADRFALSVRTVDNHLGTVYRKLALDGREQLREVFPHVDGRTPGPPWPRRVD